MNTNPTITQGIADFLSRVSQHLGQKTAEEKQEILTDLESHIYEALATRAQRGQPTLEDLQAVLAEMDSPESHGQASETDGGQRCTRRTMGIVALSISLGSIILAICVAVFVDNLGYTWRRHLPDEGRLGYLVFLAGQFSAFILGLIAWRNPFGKAAVIVSTVLVFLSLGLLFCTMPVKIPQ